jgi:hypothetical protein
MPCIICIVVYPHCKEQPALTQAEEGRSLQSLSIGAFCIAHLALLTRLLARRLLVLGCWLRVEAVCRLSCGCVSA